MRRRLPSPATLISLLALFVALGAGAYAATKAPKNSVTSKSIKNGQVKGKDLAANSVDTANIKGDAVKGAQIAPGAVGGSQIEDGSVGVGELTPAAQPDKDLDLLRFGPTDVDDPTVGAPPVTTEVARYGPFTVNASCLDNGANAQTQFTITSSEHGWVTTTTATPDDINAGETLPLAGVFLGGPNLTTTTAATAISDSGRFISVATIVVTKPGGTTDCKFQTSGFGS